MLLLTALMLPGCNGGGGGSNFSPSDPAPTPETNNPPPVIPPIAGSPHLDPQLPLSNVKIAGGDFTSDAGECTAIGLDSQGTVHIVYYSDSEGSPKHAFCEKNCSDPGSWTVEFIDDNRDRSPQLGRDINLVIDSNDQLHVSYRDVLNSTIVNHEQPGDSIGIIKYASKSISGGGWTPMLVEDTPGGVTDTYIDVAENQVHISYHRKSFSTDPTDALIYASCVLPCSSSWIKTVVDQGEKTETGAPNHITVANNKVHISYYSAGKLKYAVCSFSDDCTQSSSWHLKPIDEGKFELGRDNSLAVRADGSVHVTYFDNGNGNDNGTGTDSDIHPYLKYASCPADCAGGGVWRSIPVDGFDNVPDGTDNRVDVGRSSQIKISADGTRLHVSYREMDINRQDLKYATCSLTTDCLSASNWSHYWIETGGVGWDTYLAVESNGTVHISYRDNANRALKYAFGAEPPIP